LAPFVWLLACGRVAAGARLDCVVGGLGVVVGNGDGGNRIVVDHRVAGGRSIVTDSAGSDDLDNWHIALPFSWVRFMVWFMVVVAVRALRMCWVVSCAAIVGFEELLWLV